MEWGNGTDQHKAGKEGGSGLVLSRALWQSQKHWPPCTMVKMGALPWISAIARGETESMYFFFLLAISY